MELVEDAQGDGGYTKREGRGATDGTVSTARRRSISGMKRIDWFQHLNPRHELQMESTADPAAIPSTASNCRDSESGEFMPTGLAHDMAGYNLSTWYIQGADTSQWSQVFGLIPLHFVSYTLPCDSAAMA